MGMTTVVAILVVVVLFALVAGAWLQWRRRRGQVVARSIREKRR